MNKFTIQFMDADDAQQFRRYVEKAKTTEGTVSGLYAGLMCSALKRAKVKESKPKQQKP